ncbi:hypothetical protein F5Y08DRAFT_33806 [Xylaria arbuscula]|nr:hypothetical protein F5Y08DRAFT_33806 [Xylaria arbuscula]
MVSACERYCCIGLYWIGLDWVGLDGCGFTWQQNAHKLGKMQCENARMRESGKQTIELGSTTYFLETRSCFICLACLLSAIYLVVVTYVPKVAFSDLDQIIIPFFFVLFVLFFFLTFRE